MNTTKERMALLYKLKKQLLNNFYEKQIKARNEELCNIATNNQQILRANTPTFMFENIWYADFYPFNPKPSASTKNWNRILHASFLERVHELVHYHEYESVEDHAQISNLIGNILNECKEKTDLFNLLPIEITGNNAYNLMTISEWDTFNIDLPLNQEKIQRVKKQNAAGYSCLGKVIFTNLLLPK